MCVCVCVCVRWSENLFVCFGAKPTQRTEDEISRETGSGGGKEGPMGRQRGQLTKEDGERSRQRRAEETSRLEIVVQGKDGQQKGKQSKVSWHSLWLLQKFRPKYTHVIVYRCTENAKCHKTPFLALGADPSPCLFVCSFSSTLSVVFYVAVKKCVIPLSETTG